MEVLVDSGAAATVVPEKLLPDHAIRQGSAARRGVHYLAADGGRIPNLGELDVQFLTREQHRCSMTFQVADVSKPILSVSDVVAKGNDVSFHATGGTITNHRSKTQISFHNVGGVYLLTVLIAPPRRQPAPGREEREASASIPSAGKWAQGAPGADGGSPGFTRQGR